MKLCRLFSKKGTLLLSPLTRLARECGGDGRPAENEGKPGSSVTPPGHHADHHQGLSTLPFSLRCVGLVIDKMYNPFPVLEFPFLLSITNNPLWCCQQLIDEDVYVKGSPAQRARSKERKYLTHNCQQRSLTTSSETLTGGSNTGTFHPYTLSGRFELHLAFEYLTLTCLIFSKVKGIKDELFKRLMFLKPKEKSHSHAALYQKLISQALIF